MSKFSSLAIIPLVAIGLAVGWFAKVRFTAGENREDDQVASNTFQSAQSESRNVARPQIVKGPVTSEEDLGGYQIDPEGRRVYAGPRDITVLQRLAELHTDDMMGVVEVIGQLSQMNAEELSQAWKEFSKNDPGNGLGSQLLAVHVASRLRAAGIDFEMPGGWAKAESLLPESFAIDEVRQNPELFREKILAGEDLSTVQRQAVFRGLAAENPAEAARLWAENSSPQQLMAEADNLSFLLLDPSAREPLLKLMTDPATSEEQQSLLAASLGQEWAAQDPDAFEAWLDETGNAKLKENAGFILLNARSDTDPLRAVEFARTLSPKMRDDGLLQATESLANYNRQAGRNLIEQITDQEERDIAVKGFGYVMAVDHPEEFAAWRATLPPAEQDLANQAAFTFFAKDQPSEAQDWLAKQAEGPEKERLKVELMSTFYERPLGDQLDLLKTVTDSEYRRQAAGIVLQGIDPNQLETIQRVLDAAQGDPPS